MNVVHNFKGVSPSFPMTSQYFSAILLCMIIHQACINDIDRMMAIIKACIAVHQSRGIFQWTERYPDRKIISGDIERKHLFVARNSLDGPILGLAAVDPFGTNEVHENVSWDCNETPVFIARVAVDPASQGQGIGNRLFSYAEQFAHCRGSQSLRLDVDALQEQLVSMYERRGYTIRSSVWYDNPPKEFYAMEKEVTPIDIHWASDNELPNIFTIRHKVFTEGQDVSKELEQDGLDDQAKHVILYDNTTPVGCARIRWVSLDKEGSETKTLVYWKVERLAVLESARRKGYGTLVMDWIIREARENTLSGLTLHAQKHLEQFYRSFGFLPDGKPFVEAGIQHITMTLKLKS